MKISGINVILFFIFLPFGAAIYAQNGHSNFDDCPDECKKKILFFFKTDDFSKGIINKIEKEKFEQAYSQLMAAKEEHSYLASPKTGSGCFFFYYGLAKLAWKSIEDPIFQASVEIDASKLKQLRKQGREAAIHALEILEDYQKHFEQCGNKLAKINQVPYMTELEDLREKLSKGDLITEIVRCPDSVMEGDTLFIELALSNKGPRDIEDNFVVMLECSLEDRREMIEIPHLFADSSRLDTLLKYHITNTRDIEVMCRADEYASIPELKEDNNTIRRVIKVIPAKPTVIPDKGNPEEDSIVGPPSTTFLPCTKLVYETFDSEITTSIEQGECTNGHCLLVTHHFDLSILRTDLTEYFDKLYLGKFKKLVEQKEDINLEIEVTGYSDGSSFKEGGKKKFSRRLLAQLQSNPRNLRYYSINEQRPKTIDLASNWVDTNEELAFIRAFAVKSEMLRIFGLDSDAIQIKTQTTTYQGENFRKALAKICTKDLSEADFNQLSSSINERLTSDGQILKIKSTPPPIDSKQHKDSVMVLDKLYFVTNRIEITSKGLKQLNLLISYLMKNPQTKIEILGYAAGYPDGTTSERLSYSLADQVGRYLQDNDIPSSRFTCRGYGTLKPPYFDYQGNEVLWIEIYGAVTGP